MNEITIAGTAISNPVFANEVKNKKFYSFFISCERLSGTADVLPCLASESLAESVKAGEKIKLVGEVRTRNQFVSGKRRVHVYVFAKELEEYTGKDMNFVKAEGFLCKDALYRLTPSGGKVADFILASNRAIKKSDYIPCITWNDNAAYMPNVKVGSKLGLYGRLQSREYKKTVDGVETIKTAYELSASDVVILGRE